jgi:predicted nuclease of predicted toxin-antitoxin system
MASLYTNENIPLAMADRLRQLGHDVLTVQESGLANKKTADSAVLEFASTQRRIVVTFNRRDFIRLHALRPEHEGIIVCTADPDLIGLADRVHQVLAGHPSLGGRLIRVNRPG